MKDNKSNETKNFDDMQQSGEHALSQLNIINQYVQNFDRLKKALDNKNGGVVQVQQKKKVEKNEAA
jgi:hypothetical protein